MSKLKVIDFYGTFCVPCKMLAPIIDQLITQYSEDENVEVLKLNVEENVELAKSYNIRTVPTILFIKDDEVVHKINGATNKQTILNKINELV